jgi:hypothetical protein
MDCLPYVLAGEGYDVWVGNNRGPHHSDRNKGQGGIGPFVLIILLAMISRPLFAMF